MVSHIFHAAPITFKLLLLIALTSACASTEHRYDGFSPITQVYNDDFEAVWRAAQIAMQEYPMRINNIDKGILETDWIKGFESWKPPYNPPISYVGARYKLILRAIKGRIKGEEAIKVSLQKTIEKKRDFFADIEKPASDAMEEKKILYRIEREVQIDRALQMAQEQMNN